VVQWISQHIEGDLDMRAEQTQSWQIGDYFWIKLKNGSYMFGQILDASIPHTASCAFFERTTTVPPNADVAEGSLVDDVIATATVIEAHLDRGAWRVFSRGAVVLPKPSWPNESTRDKGWIGSKVYSGAIIESFLNAYQGLEPWNQYHDPSYLDKLLISPSKKPANLFFKTA
jgi:hypothetical protein